MSSESWFKVSLPAFPAAFTIFGVGLYWGENPLPLLPPSIAFWGLVILFYLFTHLYVPNRAYPLLFTIFVSQSREILNFEPLFRFHIYPFKYGFLVCLCLCWCWVRRCSSEFFPLRTVNRGQVPRRSRRHQTGGVGSALRYLRLFVSYRWNRWRFGVL